MFVHLSDYEPAKVASKYPLNVESRTMPQEALSKGLMGAFAPKMAANHLCVVVSIYLRAYLLLDCVSKCAH